MKKKLLKSCLIRKGIDLIVFSIIKQKRKQKWKLLEKSTFPSICQWKDYNFLWQIRIWQRKKIKNQKEKSYWIQWFKFNLLLFLLFVSLNKFLIQIQPVYRSVLVFLRFIWIKNLVRKKNLENSIIQDHQILLTFFFFFFLLLAPQITNPNKP